MKAAVYYRNGPPEVFTIEEVPDPVAGAGMVVVRVEAVSIEGGDTLNRLQGELVTTPHIVGYQAAGTIVEVGEGVPIAYGPAHDCLFEFGRLRAGEIESRRAVGRVLLIPGKDQL